jgi:amino acid permease
MIAIGGAIGMSSLLFTCFLVGDGSMGELMANVIIGTGLFVGSGKALAAGGPGSLLVAFSIVGLMLYCTVYSLGEMSCMFPIAGSFMAFSTRFLDPAWGFAMGWNVSTEQV